jgi:hypothetical protein
LRAAYRLILEALLIALLWILEWEYKAVKVITAVNLKNREAVIQRITKLRDPQRSFKF